jgi:2,4-dienoyl-CoA reductase-like NADH-dependent reductase (Old Yellow Enzyme family)
LFGTPLYRIFVNGVSSNSFCSISATDRLEAVFSDQPSWRLDDSIRLAHLLAEHGVDVLDVSSAGNHPQQTLPAKGTEAFHADLSAAIKASLGSKLIVTTVGGITNGDTAQAVLDKGQADAIFVGRQFQREPGTVLKFAEDLGVSIALASQIGWAFSGRGLVRPRS